MLWVHMATIVSFLKAKHNMGPQLSPPSPPMPPVQQQPSAQTGQANNGGKFNFPCDNCDQYGHGTNYCPYPQDDLNMANKKAARAARIAEADEKQKHVNQILTDAAFITQFSYLPVNAELSATAKIL